MPTTEPHHRPAESAEPEGAAPLYALSACEIREGLDEGRFSSEELVAELIERRKEVDPRINSFVAVCDDAIEMAAQADRERPMGRDLGPLHGIPITIKDNVDLSGYDSTLGLSPRVGVPATSDAVLVAELRKLGVVFMGKTNVPQALLAQESENIVFGSTKNPWDLGRTPGGSSGGEAAAVAAGLVPWGIGTDIGGSIRIPAHFTGLVGFKPSLDRWSNRGSNSAIKGQEVVRAQIGCLTRSVADVELMWKAVDPSRMAAGDPLVPPMPCGDALASLEGMTIGFCDDDDFLAPCESIRRALAETRAVLENAGAKVVSHWPVASKDVLGTWLAALTSDSGRTMMDALGGDPISTQLKPSTALLKVPKPLKRMLGGVLSSVGERRLAMLLEVVGEKNVTELWRLTQRRSELRLQEFDAWNRAGLDALVCPPHVVPAIGLGQSGDFALSLGAMFRWTLLNFPAGVVPVTRVRESEASYGDTSDRIGKKAASIMQGAAGLPIGVQVVARPYAEEALLGVMSTIEAGVRSSLEYPRTPIQPVG